MRRMAEKSRLQLSRGSSAFVLVLAAGASLLSIQTSSAAPPYGRAYRWRPGDGLRAAANGAPGNSATRAAAAQQRALFLQQFDTDGNGQLSTQEVVAAKKAIADMQKAQRAALNGNAAVAGQPQEQDPDAPANDNPAQAGKKAKAKRGERKPMESFVDLFDKDGDGTLNADEVTAARQAFARRQK